MSNKAKVPTWLYHREKGAKIHELALGAPPPKGWRDTPWPEEKPAAKPDEARTSAQKIP
jgi:hypothetical protein